MVARDSIAVAVRAKDGISFLIQTKGLDAKAVADAANHAAHALTHHAETHGRGDEDWSGDNAPAFAFDEVPPASLCRHNLRVMFRKLHLVWVLVIFPLSGSALAALQVLDQVIRVCTAAARSLDVTPEKLTKKFPEVYLAISIILANSGQEPARILAEAELEAAVLAGNDANKGLAAKAAATVAKGSKLTNILTTGFGAAGAGAKTPRPATTAADDSVGSAQSSVIGRKLAEETEPLAAAGFELPQEALLRVTLADAQATDQSAATAAALEGTGLEHLSGGGGIPLGALGSPQPASPSLAGTGLESLISPPAGASPWGVASAWGANSQPLDPGLFGGLSPPLYTPQAVSNPWAASPGGHAPQTAAAPTPATPAPGPQVSAASSPSPPKEKPLPAASPRDAKAIARGRGLLLVELWRATFIGASLVRAGLQGEVVGSGKLSRSRASALYRLAAPPGSAATVSASLRAAALDTALGERGSTPGSFIAHLGAVSKKQAVFLRYRLPAIACSPPLLLSLTATPGLGPRHSEPGVLLVIQYAVSPILPAALRSATLDVDVPAALGPPTQAAPHGAWSLQQRRIRWHLEVLDPGSTSVLCVTFGQPAVQEEAHPAPATPKSPASPPKTPKSPLKSPSPAWKSSLAKAMTEAQAVLCFVGPSEATLSGIRLSSGAETDTLRPLVGARCAFHGEVTARPIPTTSI